MYILTRTNGSHFQMYYDTWDVYEKGEWRGYVKDKLNLPYVFKSFHEALFELKHQLRTCTESGWTYSVDFYDR